MTLKVVYYWLMKAHHYIFSVIITLVCLFCILSYGYLLYSSLAGHSGLNADYSMYYKGISKGEFDLYNFLVSISAIFLIASIVKSNFSRNLNKFRRSMFYFLCFFVVLSICEIYLNSIFIGKG